MRCKKCGTQLTDDAVFCPACGQAVAAQSDEPSIDIKENVLLGTLGALLGAALGSASIILLSQINIVSALSGLLIAFCALKGYEILGGKLSTLGIIISIVFVLIAPYFADRINWALLIIKEYPQFSFSEAFRMVPEWAKNGTLIRYTAGLVQLYLFAVLGAVGTLVGAFQRR